MARDDGRITSHAWLTITSNAVFITWTDDDGAASHSHSVQISPGPTAPYAITKNCVPPKSQHAFQSLLPQGVHDVRPRRGLCGRAPFHRRRPHLDRTHTIGASDTEYTYPVVGHDGAVTAYDAELGRGLNGPNLPGSTKSHRRRRQLSSLSTVALTQQPNSPYAVPNSFASLAILGLRSS